MTGFRGYIGAHVYIKEGFFHGEKCSRRAVNKIVSMVKKRFDIDEPDYRIKGTYLYVREDSETLQIFHSRVAECMENKDVAALVRGEKEENVQGEFGEIYSGVAQTLEDERLRKLYASRISAREKQAKGKRLGVKSSLAKKLEKINKKGSK